MTIPAHAELIHAFADGKTLQFKFRDMTWENWTQKFCPHFQDEDREWRIKVEPKVTRYLAYEDHNGWMLWRNDNYSEDCGYKRIPALDKEVTEEE